MFIPSEAHHRLGATRHPAQIRENSDVDRNNEFVLDLATQVSHDIRLPVSNIIGMTDLLMRTPLNLRQQEYLALLKVSAEAALGLVNGLLDLKRMDGDGLLLEEVAFDLHECVQHVVRVVSPAANGKNISLRCDIGPGVPQRVIGDPLRLGQVLTNLLDNAVKFTSEGDVRLEIRRISGTAEHVRLHVSVIDSGAGIPAERQQDIFSPFVRGDHGNRRRSVGVGLGLSIAAGLVKRMGGQVSVESEPGYGSVFGFGLDFALPTWKVAGNQSGKALRVLIADDDAISRELARQVLIDAGFDVDFAVDGENALKSASSGTYDLLLMDIFMPGMNGLVAARNIRREMQPGMRRTTIIALTAGSDDIHRCMRAGMDDYLVKPLTIDALQHALARSSVPVINHQNLIERVNGNTTLLIEVAEIYARQSISLLADIKAALHAGNETRLWRDIHTLAGMLKNLSAEAALGALVEFRRQAAAGLPGTRQALYRLTSELERLGFTLGEVSRIKHGSAIFQG